MRLSITSAILLLILISVCILPTNCLAVVRYVKTGSAGTAPYTSWATASSDLQAVINACAAGDEIWMAAGTYKPNRRADAVTIITATDRNNAFVLKNNVKIYGGFVGTETLLSQRNTASNVVVFSGDIGTVGVTTDNCYHVIVCAGLAGTQTLLDGITITRGNANAAALVPNITVNTHSINPRYGGALYKISATVKFINCSFNQSNASLLGGGIYEITATVNTTYLNCKFARNTCAGDGAGIYTAQSSAQFDSCSITQNIATGEGGGLYASGTGSPEFSNGTIASNEASSNGGGVASYTTGIFSLLQVYILGNTSAVSGGGLFASNSPVKVVNGQITGNLAASGGAIWNAFSDALLVNCTIAANRATAQGGGIGNGSSNPTIHNCIVYGNTGVPASTNALYNSGSVPTVSYSLVQGGYAGANNVNADPLFVSPANASAAPITTGNFQLQKCSPALNGGDNASIPSGITNDLLGNNRIHYGIVDIGAFELPIILAVPDANGIVYVDYTKNGNGSSWSNAVAELSDALVAAKYNAAIEQIWVAKGTYYPRYNRTFQNLDCNSTNRNNAFVMVDNLKLYGGFAGGETDTIGRNLTLNATTLSGNINLLALNTDNCFTVLLNNTSSGTTALNGFTVTEGNGPGSAGLQCTSSNMLIGNCIFSNHISANSGGAIQINSAVATLTYCSFVSNKAGTDGGAIVTQGSTVTINRSSFTSNTASEGGGAIYNTSAASLVVKNCLFQSNAALVEGGAILNNSAASIQLIQSELIGNSAANGGALHVENSSATPVIMNCSFRGNVANNYGGAACLHISCELRNNLFSGNYAIDKGGAIHYAMGTSYDVNSCTIAANRAGNVGAAIIADAGTLNLRNSVISLNDGPIVVTAPTINATYTLAHVTYPGTGNIGLAASFYNSPPGSTAPFTNGDFHLTRCSLGLNSGSNALLSAGHTYDLDSNKRIAYATVDMGAYETQLALADLQGIVYVDSSRTNVIGTGKSWNDALTQLADAVKAAGDNPAIKEIWVAKGTYKPLFDATDPYKQSLCSFFTRDVAFLLTPGLKIYGGFTGTETSLAQRNISLNPTILSGDVGIANDTSDNAYHVVVASNATDTMLLDGLIITQGNTRTNPTAAINGLSVNKQYGGGVCIKSAPVNLANCTITSNTANQFGGGLYAETATVNLFKCSVERNVAYWGGGAFTQASTLNSSSSLFRANKSTSGGGLNFNNLSNGRIVSAVLSGNEAQYGGGFLVVANSTVELINSSIAGNKATVQGGGIHCASGTNTVKLKNSILWGNTASSLADGYSIYPFTSNPEINQCIIENGFVTGTNILNLDPQFISPQPAASAPTVLGDYRLQACSPALNMGDNAFLPVEINNDADSATRIRFSTIDLGAFEKQDIDLTQSTWKGINANWNDKINWCGGFIPADTTSVAIPATPNQPAIGSGFSNAVKNIVFENNSSLTVAVNSRFSIHGTYVNNGAAIANNGSWFMKGNAGAQVFPGTQGTITAMHNLEVDNPSGLTLNKSFGITGALTARNGIITLLNDTITLKSSATATARIDTVHSGAGFAYSGTGKFEIERFIPAHKAWRLLTAPVNAYQSIKADWQENQTNSTLTNSNLYPGYGTHISGPQTGSGFDFTNTNFPSMLEYIPATNSLSGIPNTNVLNLNYRPGYFLFLHGSRAYDLTLNNLGTTDNTILRSRGSIRTGPQSMAVAANGFTLIGNPYASTIDFDQLGKTNLGNKFIVWDPSRSGSYGYGGYVAFTRVGAAYVAAPTPASAGLNQYIQSGYAFLVEGTGVPGSIQFEEQDKVSGSASTVFRQADSTIASLRINLIRVGNSGGESLADGTLAVFHATAYNALDEMDAGKKLNDNQNIGLICQGKVLAIEARQPILQSDTLFIATVGLQARTYKLEFIPEQISRPGLQAFLVDGFLHTRTLLTLTDTSRYSFVATADTISFVNRFSVVFESATAGPVPVRLLDLDVSCESPGRTIRFAVSNETNVTGYSIQQSSNGRQFYEIAHVPVSPEQAAVKTYQIPVTTDYATNAYFRIQSVEASGPGIYSEVRFAPSCTGTGTISVYPNPVMRPAINLYIRHQVPGTYQACLFGADGKMLLQQSIHYTGGLLHQKLQPVRWLSAGQYVLKIRFNTEWIATIPVLVP